MIKAVKKLKRLWPRKKRKKKTYHYQDPFYYLPPPPPCPPPPPPCHCCCSCSAPVQPSAPPLPPWLDMAHQSISVPEEVGYQSQNQFPSEEICVVTDPICPTLRDETPFSYQQYTVQNPVYGAPVGQRKRREKSGGLFGCVIEFGLNLIRCFCPCFRIREVD